MKSPKKPSRFAACVVLGMPLLALGCAKLAGMAEFREMFNSLALPGWFNYFIGACEVLGAIGLFVPRVRRLAAVGIGTIMLGALYYHVRFTPLVQGIPALVFLMLAGYVATRPDVPLFPIGGNDSGRL